MSEPQEETKMTIQPDYSYWRNALEGDFGAVHDGDPQPGFYRKRNKSGTDQACAIWVKDGEFVATLDGEPVNAPDIWSWVCQNPITHEEFNAFKDTGSWPDDAPAIGHNAETGDPHSDLLIEFAGEKEQAEEFLKTPITTQEQADRAAVWSKRLSVISKKATDQHKVEKQPHLDAGRAVDDRWRDLKEEPKALSTRLKRHMDDFLREQANLEEQRRKEAEAEAERKRIEAEKAANAAQNEKDAEEALRLKEEAEKAESATKAQNSSAGRTGAKVALREFVSGQITDYDKLVIALKDREEMKELVQSLANRAARAGVELEGMKINKEKRAA